MADEEQGDTGEMVGAEATGAEGSKDVDRSETTDQIELGATASNNKSNPAKLCQILRVDNGSAINRSGLNTRFITFVPATGDKGVIGISRPAYDIRKETRVWMAVPTGNGHAMNRLRDLSRGANENVMVTDVNRRGQLMTRIINI